MVVVFDGVVDGEGVGGGCVYGRRLGELERVFLLYEASPLFSVGWLSHFRLH